MVTTVTTTSMTISFDPPQTHQQCVKEYDIRIVDEEAVRVARQGVSPYLTNEISGLVPCTEYLVSVRAVTPSNLFSPWEDIRNRTADDVASEPQAFKVTDATTTSISLEWFSPATNPNCVVEYQLAWDSGEDIIPADGSFKVEYDATGLVECTDYTFTLTAINDAASSASVQATGSTVCTA